MKLIKLTQNRFVMVDDEDFDYLNQWKWYYETNGYAVRKTTHKIYMHRLIINCPKGFEVDHINRDRLDNRKNNLRIVNRMQNAQNVSVRSDNKVGQSGICWRKDRSKWMVYINRGLKRTYLGNFINLEDAIRARKSMEWTP